MSINCPVEYLCDILPKDFVPKVVTKLYAQSRSKNSSMVLSAWNERITKRMTSVYVSDSINVRVVCEYIATAAEDHGNGSVYYHKKGYYNISKTALGIFSYYRPNKAQVGRYIPIFEYTYSGTCPNQDLYILVQKLLLAQNGLFRPDPIVFDTKACDPYASAQCLEMVALKPNGVFDRSLLNPEFDIFFVIKYYFPTGLPLIDIEKGVLYLATNGSVYYMTSRHLGDQVCLLQKNIKEVPLVGDISALSAAAIEKYCKDMNADIQNTRKMPSRL